MVLMRLSSHWLDDSMAESSNTSAGAAAQQHDGNCLKKDLAIKGGRPVIDVFQVKFHDAPEPECAAPFQRPKASETGRHTQSAPLPPLVLLYFLRQGRARAYEGHVTPEDVEQLGQFVQTEPAHEASCGRAARIVPDLEPRTVHFVQSCQLLSQQVGIRAHRTELVECESPPSHAAACLLVE